MLFILVLTSDLGGELNMSSEQVVLSVDVPGPIESRVIERIRKMCERLTVDGKLPSREQLDTSYARFAERFGPAALKARDGTSLLEHMYDYGNRGSLAFWLEFKDDEDLPGIFGSITGGSALKFGIYRRKENGVWTTGHPNDQRALSNEEAVEIARRNRSQLLAALEVLGSAAGSFEDVAYAALQQRLLAVAPDVVNTAWAHKYLHMMCPARLDNYHVVDYQRFHLLKLLQAPPVTDGRYAAGGRFAGLAAHLGRPMIHLTRTLNELHGGRPYRYWRIGTSDGDTPRKYWPMMREGSVVAIGWHKLGDLSALTHDEESRKQIKRRLEKHYPNDPRAIGRTAQQIFNFVTALEERHLVLACDGGTILGIGRITGPYQYVASADFPHQRRVEWLDLGEWKMPELEGLLTTIYELRTPRNLIAAEKRLLAPSVPTLTVQRWESEPLVRKVPVLDKIPGEIQRILDRKGQAILYGPPGTGKTHWAERTARDLASHWAFGRPFDVLDEGEKQYVIGPAGKPLVRMCCFHPSYGYEDFIEGHRPEASNTGSLSFKLRDGVFKSLCRDAASDPDRRYYLIIDEINRGDIPRIFGELLTLLEPARRGSRSLILPLSGEAFMVPPNVYVIGTMNTADRSIALIDVALRRRFGFIELLPEAAALGSATIAGIPLGPLLTLLNQRLIKQLERDGRSMQIGHSFFLNGGVPISGVAQLRRVFLEDIIPLLEEYCYEDWQKLEQIISNKLVDVAAKRIRRELFEESAQDQFVQALRSLDASLVTSHEATTNVEPEEGTDGGGEEDEDGKGSTGAGT